MGVLDFTILYYKFYTEKHEWVLSSNQDSQLNILRNQEGWVSETGKDKERVDLKKPLNYAQTWWGLSQYQDYGARPSISSQVKGQSSYLPDPLALCHHHIHSLSGINSRVW